MGASVFPYPPA